MKSKRKNNKFWQILLAAMVVAFAAWRFYSQSGPNDLRYKAAGFVEPVKTTDPFSH